MDPIWTLTLKLSGKIITYFSVCYTIGGLFISNSLVQAIGLAGILIGCILHEVPESLEVKV